MAKIVITGRTFPLQRKFFSPAEVSQKMAVATPTPMVFFSLNSVSHKKDFHKGVPSFLF